MSFYRAFFCKMKDVFFNEFTKITFNLNGIYYHSNDVFSLHIRQYSCYLEGGFHVKIEGENITLLT